MTFIDSDHSTNLPAIIQQPPRGRPKSGRVWKTVRTERFSRIKKCKPLRTSWEVKLKERAEKKAIKEYDHRLKEEKRQEKEALRLRREANKKRREENAKKAEITQIVKNPAKIKRIRKKLLRKDGKR